MPRRPRIAPGGLVYHCLNRTVARLALFEKDADYAAFERVLEEAAQKHPTRILAYCVMPNHWHLVLWPRHEGELTEFLRWLTHTHTMRWHAHFHTSGSGHLYQGRFKAFPIQADDHFYSLTRYVERNALRANLVARAEEWRWTSLWRRLSGSDELKSLLHPWPLPMPRDWLATVNRPQSESELKAVRQSVNRGTPFGTEQWQARTAKSLGLEWTLRARGRPRKSTT
ncbi:MAG TPA: transposase [Planctomycetaceae bacterium]|nr:transposase [Planctomycetaceae bacterium]